MSRYPVHLFHAAPRLTPKGHEMWAEAHASTAQGFLRDAPTYAPGRLRRACLELAAEHDGRAAGHAFRAAELRYDARGGMTEEFERRRFEPGARWTTRWTPGEVYTVLRQEERGGGPWVHFDRCWPEPAGIMSSGRGWLFLDLGAANGGRVPPGGWP